jgi:hypothetical protein
MTQAGCVTVGGMQRPGPGCYAGIDAGYRPALGVADEPGWLPAIAPQSHRGPGQKGATRAEMGDGAPIRGLGTNTSGDAAPDRGTPPLFGGRGINTSGDDTPQRGRETDHVPVWISCLPNGDPQAGMEPGAARWGHDGSPRRAHDSALGRDLGGGGGELVVGPELAGLGVQLAVGVGRAGVALAGAVRSAPARFSWRWAAWRSRASCWARVRAVAVSATARPVTSFMPPAFLMGCRSGVA